MDGAKIQAYAGSIEHDLRYEYNCDRSGIGGIADADHIRRSGFYHCMAMVLVKYYFGENRKLVDDFLNENWDIDGIRMDEVGLKKVEDLFEKYNELYKAIKK